MIHSKVNTLVMLTVLSLSMQPTSANRLTWLDKAESKREHILFQVMGRLLEVPSQQLFQSLGKPSWISQQKHLVYNIIDSPHGCAHGDLALEIIVKQGIIKSFRFASLSHWRPEGVFKPGDPRLKTNGWISRDNYLRLERFWASHPRNSNESASRPLP